MSDTDLQRARERALAMADEGSRKLISASRDLIIAIYSAIKVRRFHQARNEAVTRALGKLRQAFAALFEIQYDVQLMYYAQDFYVNETRIKVSREVYEFFAAFASELEQRKIGGLNLRTTPTEAQLLALIEAYEAIGSLPKGVDPFNELERRLLEARAGIFGLTRLVDGDLVEMPVIDARTFVKQSYFRAIEVAQNVYSEARRGRPLTLKHVKRVVQNFVDVLFDKREDTTDLLILLTDVKNWRGYLPNHAVNVCVLSLFIGKALGLSRLALRDLGMAALLSDIGNAALPPDLLDSDQPLTPEQREQIDLHPIRGVPILTRYQEMDSGAIKSVVASLHHHKGLDGAGYPEKVASPQTLFPQIIAICDRYDAMTTSRPYRPEPLSPPEAVSRLVDASAKQLDPVLVKLFVHWMGTVPAGTVVVLPNGDVGVVVQAQSRLGRQADALVKVLLGRQAANEPIPIDSKRLVADPATVGRAVGDNKELLTTGRLDAVLAA